jgi:hypothetical protein
MSRPVPKPNMPTSDELAAAEPVAPSVNGPTPSDPFDDLDSLRVSNVDDVTVEKILLTVPVRRPRKSEFIRVHPGPEYTIQTAAYERQVGMERETYLISPGLHTALAEELRVVRIFTCVNKREGLFLWPIKLPLGDRAGSGRRWSETALEIAEMAKTAWVKLVASQEGYYVAFEAKGNLGDPDWPIKSFKELLRLAFKDHFIDRADHEVIRELAGEM